VSVCLGGNEIVFCVSLCLYVVRVHVLCFGSWCLGTCFAACVWVCDGSYLRVVLRVCVSMFSSMWLCVCA